MKRFLPIPVIAVLLAAAAPAPAPLGGWAVITVEDVPEYFEAGRPVSLAFTIRQHGESPMNNLEPTVTLRQKGERRVWSRRSVKAVRAAEPGRYQATLTPQDTGDVVISIDANWHTAETTLLPIRVVAAGTTVAALPSADRGRQLFVAKGCVSCHTKRDDRLMVGRNDANIGPDLTGRAFAPEWLAVKLADPARNRVRTNDYVLMPTLGLDDREVAVLVQYLNRPALDAAANAPAPRSGS
jgi:hypothetical protein